MAHHLEADAGRAVELADDDALGAVDDEGAAVGHERDLAQGDGLLLGVLAVGGADAERGLQAGLVRLAGLEADDLRCRGRGQAVADELQLRMPIGRGGGLGGEDVLERGLEPLVQTLVRTDVGLQEVGVGLRLYLNQVGNRNDLLQTAEVHPVVRALRGNRLQLAGIGVGAVERLHIALSLFRPVHFHALSHALSCLLLF